MLVVDEAHRPALRAFDKNPADRRLYEALRTIAEKVPRLLLLSGRQFSTKKRGSWRCFTCSIPPVIL